mmetsp:Transcript_105833/g.207584  ORF Transcript_105833/g.207584 Transcript_105833/m.207584 type:complete len:234 (-) Transcript_105833:378-1079(-)
MLYRACARVGTCVPTSRTMRSWPTCSAARFAKSMFFLRHSTHCSRVYWLPDTLKTTSRRLPPLNDAESTQPVGSAGRMMKMLGLSGSSSQTARLIKKFTAPDTSCSSRFVLALSHQTRCPSFTAQVRSWKTPAPKVTTVLMRLGLRFSKVPIMAGTAVLKFRKAVSASFCVGRPVSAQSEYSVFPFFFTVLVLVSKRTVCCRSVNLLNRPRPPRGTREDEVGISCVSAAVSRI